MAASAPAPSPAPVPAIEAGDLFNQVLAASRYNRELNRLAAAIRKLRDRLDAFVDIEPALELVNGLVARGVPRSEAVKEVTEFTASFDGPARPQQAAAALVWALTLAADEFEGAALRAADWPG